VIYTITIPHWHPVRLNKLLNSHWASANRMKQSDAQMIGVYCYQSKVPKATDKRKVGIEIVLGKGQRGGDPDAYFKVVCDALVRLGYLKDDNRQWLDLEPVKYSRGNKATIITIADIG
jgi:hypothetical protein